MDETSLAFSSLEDRAQAMGARDRIALRDYVCEVEIGAYHEERGQQQRLKFDVVVEVVLGEAPLDDDVDRIVSYDTLVDAIDGALKAERLELLETLAERVAATVLKEPRAARVFIRIQKLDRGDYTLGVEIVRGRGETRAELAHDLKRPVVVFVSSAALGDARLGGWLEQCAVAGQPVILAPDAAERPEALGEQASARVALLSMEQNAWVLAGRDARCVVAGSRSELSWCIARGNLAVWAPSKMVLAGVDVPSGGAEDLARWFAARVNASQFLALGGNSPDRLELAP
ncbi:dihydroneopterin aldolase [Vannielia sp.]|uniref:dihydroneopterin aldolase n=1 Tax=Vannielia sp. TaxID=2813045 RepID=UPI002617BA21|nr:dihydroneopterin aldolase [Vannielia sp.]MDF1871222.1 dihydroneopterin aldolase [Vannielia sp.]